jgi:hypothetical protein
MGYQIDIEEDFDRERFCDPFGSHVVAFVLGADLNDDLVVVMLVAFIPGPRARREELDEFETDRARLELR